MDIINLVIDLIKTFLDVIIGWYFWIPITLYSILTVFGVLFSSLLQNKPFIVGKNGVSIPSNFGIFSPLSPGHAKIKERGETPVGFLMNYGKHTYSGGPYGDLSDSINFKVTLGDGSTLMNVLPIPKPFLYFSQNKWFGIFDILLITHRYMWWFCKFIIYKLNGMIFAGIQPWQTIRIYKLEYLKLENGILVSKSNYSDHFRVMPFDVFVKIQSVETKDNVVLEVVFHLICQVDNPYLTAYEIPKNESWYNRISGLLAGKARDYYRVKDYHETLFGKTDLTNSIEEEMKVELPKIGMKATKITVFDQTVADENLMKALGAVAIAKAKSTARVVEAEGESKGLHLITKEVKEGGRQGELVYNKESTIRAISAAPQGALVSINTAKDSKEEDDAVRKGILVETRNSNKKK